MTKRKLIDMPEKFRERLFDIVLNINTLTPTIRKPEEHTKKILDKSEKTTRRWHAYCYFKGEELTKLKNKQWKTL